MNSLRSNYRQRGWVVLAVAIIVLIPALISPTALAAGENPRYLYVDLGAYFNNDGISWDEDTLDGDFDFSSITLPAEQLPESNSTVSVGQGGFVFPDKANGKNNNVMAFAQRIPVPQGRYQQFQVLITSSQGLQKPKFTLEYSDGSVEEKAFPLRDFGPIGGQGQFGALSTDHRHNTEGDATPGTKIWVVLVGVNVDKELTAIVLPDNSRVRIFALTLVAKD